MSAAGRNGLQFFFCRSRGSSEPRSSGSISTAAPALASHKSENRSLFTLPRVTDCQNWSGCTAPCVVNVGDAPAGTVRAAAIPLEQAKGFLRQGGNLPGAGAEAGKCRPQAGSQSALHGFFPPLSIPPHGQSAYPWHSALLPESGSALPRRGQWEPDGKKQTRWMSLASIKSKIWPMHCTLLRGQRQAQARLLPHFAAKPEPAHRLLKRTFHTTEFVMNSANAVQGNAYVRHAQFLEPRCSFRRGCGCRWWKWSLSALSRWHVSSSSIKRGCTSGSPPEKKRRAFTL